MPFDITFTCTEENTTTPNNLVPYTPWSLNIGITVDIVAEWGVSDDNSIQGKIDLLSKCKYR